MRYALEGQGLGYLYETANVAAGFKTWLKYINVENKCTRKLRVDYCVNDTGPFRFSRKECRA